MRDHAGVAGGNGNTPAIARCRTKTRGLDSSAGRRACWFVQYGLDLGPQPTGGCRDRDAMS